MIRAFIAIDLPDPVRQKLGELQDRLRQARPLVSVSWTRLPNLHLTLQFLGSIPEELVPRLGQALNQVAARHSAFELAVGGVGGFPNVRAPRVLWVGCTDPAGRLRELAQQVQQATQPLGFAPEHRAFAAHLSLGRIKAPRPDASLTKLLGSLRDCCCGTMRVEAVELCQSQLHPHGSIYTKLSSHPLQGD